MNEKKLTVLVVDDNEDIREVVQRNLEDNGYNVLTAREGGQAVSFLENGNIDLVITDNKMPGPSGMDIIRHLNDNYSDIVSIMITGYPSIEGAVDAVKTGAEEYLAKPFTEEELLCVIKRAVARLKIKSVVEDDYNMPREPYGLVGRSECMLRVFDRVAKASENDATVLIIGESGTGKELVARAIHYSSKRRTSPFVPVNCSAIPETLVESELFGHSKGAFTGASEARAGFFQAAERGTIFLDEISDMSMSMQAKMLRVLQEREIMRVGENQVRKIDVRILAASNKDLLTLVDRKSFREDLFYRFNVITIKVPSLRKRGDDILLLAYHFVDRFSRELNREKPLRFSDKALAALQNYSWPGNVRELENLVLRLMIMKEDESIEITDLPPQMRFCIEKGNPFPAQTLAEMEREYILEVLACTKGNKSRAAEILGINRKTIREKLEKYGQAD